jgi:hypothetical protein
MVNRKMIAVETLPRIAEGKMKGSSGGVNSSQ